MAYAKLDDRCSDGIGILYVDGTVTWVDRAEAKRILSCLADGMNPPRR